MIEFPVYTTIFHADWEGIFANRPYRECWELIMAMFEFMRTGEEPDFKDWSAQTAWRSICERMKHDIRKYQQRVNNN